MSDNINDQQGMPQYNSGPQSPQYNLGASGMQSPQYNPGASGMQSPQYNPGASGMQNPQYNSQGMNPQGMPQQGMSPAGPQYNPGPQSPQYNPGQSGMQNPQYNSQGMNPQGMPQQGMSPAGPQINPGSQNPQYNPGQSGMQSSQYNPGQSGMQSPQYNPGQQGLQNPQYTGQPGMDQQYNPGPQSSQQIAGQSAPYMGYKQDSPIDSGNYISPSPSGGTPADSLQKPSKTNGATIAIICVAVVAVLAILIIFSLGVINGYKKKAAEKASEQNPVTTEQTVTEDTSNSSDDNSGSDITTEDNADNGTVVDNTGDDSSADTSDTSADTSANDGAVTLSDKPEDYTFELNGVVYKLPCSYQKFADNGWTLDTNYDEKTEDTELSGTSYDWFYLTDGTTRLSIYLYNPSGNVQKAKDCKVGQIEVYAKDGVDFKVAKGLTPAATKDDVIAAFGTPSDTYEGDGYVSLTYDFDSNNYYENMSFYIKDDGSYNQIALENMIMTAADQGEASTDMPEYLSTYVAPTELGTDPTNPVFQIDGKIYRLPCPLKEFTDDGWEVASIGTKSVSAGNLEYSAITIKKGENELSLGMYNFAKVSTITENCAVASININNVKYSSGDKFGVSEDLITFPGNITLKSKREDVKKAVNETFEEYSSDENDYISYTYYGDDAYVCFTFSKGDGYESVSFDVKNTRWDY